MKDLSKEKQHDIILYVNKYFYIIRGNRWDELLNMPFGYKRLEIIKALSKYYEYQDYIDQYSKSIDLDHTTQTKRV
ncbi:MAG: hypothetical protein KatS3mg003_1078 [Candidatus Nitrosocaldaceae archaeon]|nr:MAG: hypothetical protein KatS3mg003_1078 [Candidatus Nitrosocaldaceae archaeon]